MSIHVKLQYAKLKPPCYLIFGEFKFKVDNLGLAKAHPFNNGEGGLMISGALGIGILPAIISNNSDAWSELFE